MRTVDDDLLHCILAQDPDGRLRHTLKKILIAQAPRGFTIARLLRAEDGKAHSRLFQELGERNSGFLIALVEGPGAADKVEVLCIRMLSDKGNIQSLRPICALLRA